MLYNVEVFGILVWIVWTPDRNKAVREYEAWKALGYHPTMKRR